MIKYVSVVPVNCVPTLYEQDVPGHCTVWHRITYMRLLAVH